MKNRESRIPYPTLRWRHRVLSGQIILRICILNCQVYRLHLTNTDKNKHDVPTGLIKRITVRLLTMMWLFNLVKGNISFNFATL
jgi:hypothetical protein